MSATGLKWASETLSLHAWCPALSFCYRLLYKPSSPNCSDSPCLMLFRYNLQMPASLPSTATPVTKLKTERVPRLAPLPLRSGLLSYYTLSLCFGIVPPTSSQPSRILPHRRIGPKTLPPVGSSSHSVARTTVIVGPSNPNCAGLLFPPSSP